MDQEFDEQPAIDRARPIENELHGGLHLLRLEFEIFLILDTPPAVSSSGKIACRDLVVGPAVDVSRDASLTAYADALGVRNPASDRQWLNLANKARWISVEFGPIDERDQRNSFKAIHPFQLAGRSVREYDSELDKDWVPVNVAADQFERSESTIRRRNETLRGCSRTKLGLATVNTAPEEREDGNHESHELHEWVRDRRERRLFCWATADQKNAGMAEIDSHLISPHVIFVSFV